MVESSADNEPDHPSVRPAVPRVLRPGQAPTRAPRPAPPRPDFVVSPMRDVKPLTVPTAYFAIVVAAWIAVFLLTVAMAITLYSNFDSIQTSLETGLSRQNPDSSATRVADTIRITLYGSGAIAVVLLVAAGAGLNLLNKVRGAGRVVLVVAGIAGAAASVTFWTLIADAHSPILRWGSLAAAVCCAVGVVAALLAAPRSD